MFGHQDAPSGPDERDPERTVQVMKPSLLLTVVVLIAVAAVCALMALVGIGVDADATTAPGATTVIFQDTITPTDLGTTSATGAAASSTTTAWTTSTVAGTTSTTAR